MTLRAGRAELHQRLTIVAQEVAVASADGRRLDSGILGDLLAEARDAILTCPIEGCAYCWNVTQAQRENKP